MRLIITARAEKDILKLSLDYQRKVDAALEKFLTSPETLDLKKLKGQKSHWRIRVGVYRIILLIVREEDTAYVLHVRHRRKAY